MNMLESSTNNIKINTKNATFWKQFVWKHISSIKFTFIFIN